MKKRNKIYAAIMLSVIMIMLIVPSAANAAGLDLSDLKKMYDEQIRKDSRNNAKFADSYIIDVYNNDEPVLVNIFSEAFYDIKGVCYELKDGKLKESNTLKCSYTSLSGNEIQYGFLKDGSDKTYCYKRLYEPARPNVPEGGYEDIEIGYYENGAYKKSYKYYIKTLNENGRVSEHNRTEMTYDENQTEQPCTIKTSTMSFNELVANLGLNQPDYINMYNYGSKDLFQKQQGIAYDKYYRSKIIKIMLNGAKVVCNPDPIIKDGRTLVPLRSIFEAMGARVSWDGRTRTITATNGITNISLAVDSDIMYRNDMTIQLDVPAQIYNDRTMVPVRAIAEAFGADVKWDADTRTVNITYTK